MAAPRADRGRAAVPVGPGDAFPYSATFRLLGARILVRTSHPRCLAGVGDQFSAAREDPWTTPDQIVECSWPEAERYLFRSRPAGEAATPLRGVRVLTPGGPSAEWTGPDPPLPAFRLPPIQGRFAGLHAAAVRLPAGGVLVAGARGSGKSTVAVDLVNRHGGEFLTDETVFLHRRTAVVEPYAGAVGVWEAGRLKHRVPAVDACRSVARGPGEMAALVVLHPGEPAGLRDLDAGGAFREILAHHVDVGAQADEAMTTLAGLAHRLPAASAGWSSYADLLALPDTVVAWLRANTG